MEVDVQCGRRLDQFQEDSNRLCKDAFGVKRMGKGKKEKGNEVWHRVIRELIQNTEEIYERPLKHRNIRGESGKVKR